MLGDRVSKTWHKRCSFGNARESKWDREVELEVLVLNIRTWKTNCAAKGFSPQLMAFLSISDGKRGRVA